MWCKGWYGQNDCGITALGGRDLGQQLGAVGTGGELSKEGKGGLELRWAPGLGSCALWVITGKLFGSG